VDICSGGSQPSAPTIRCRSRRPETANATPNVPANVLARQAWLDHIASIHRSLLREITVRVGHQDAEDVLQEFYLRILRYRPHLAGEASVRSFVYRILRSVVSDHYRELAAQIKVVTSLEDYWELPIAVEGRDSAEGEHLLGLVTALPQQFATLIERIDVNDESRPEVAADLGITTNNLAVRLLRARTALRVRARAISLRDGRLATTSAS